MLTEQELRAALDGLGLTARKLRIEGCPGRLVATMISPGFATMLEGQRQQKVWKHLVQTRTDVERAHVELVFTAPPDELREMERVVASG